jgi:hypothetical protein
MSHTEIQTSNDEWVGISDVINSFTKKLSMGTSTTSSELINEQNVTPTNIV